MHYNVRVGMQAHIAVGGGELTQSALQTQLATKNTEKCKL